MLDRKEQTIKLIFRIIMIFAIIIAQCGVILDTEVKHYREKYELELLRYTQIEELKKQVSGEKDEENK